MSILTLKDMENLISGFTCDCSCKYKGYETEHGGCFKQNFETDEETKWSEMSRFLLFYRMKTQNYSDVENDAFVLELVKKHATNVEDVVDETEALEKSTLGELTSTAKTTENRFKMNWNIKVKSGKLPGSRTELKLCRKAFAFLYGFTPNRFKLASQAMKTAGSSDISSIKAVRDFDHSTSFSEYTYDEVENIYMQNGLTIAGKDEIAAALLRGTYAHHDAYLWLEDYFDSFDMQPDSAQIHVDVTFKRAIYLEYCARPTDNINLRNRSLQESEFRQMWAMVYSHVRIRKLKKVSGKSTKMEPKKLVDGCVAVFTSFRSRISAHYSMNDPARKSWLDWLNKHAPLNESALNYICSHPYNCPLISYFRGLEHRPEWRLTDLVPTFSLFPSLEVLALPSAQCQFNRTGTAEPYMTLNDETNVTNTQSVMQRYTNKYRDIEILRIKRFGTKMLKAILKRKVKHNGAAFTSSGTVEKMAETIFESNLSFFSIR